MTEKKVSFSIFQLYYKSKAPGALYEQLTPDMATILPTSFDYEKGNGAIFRVNVHSADDYLFLAVNFGTADPRADKVVNIADGTERDNPRGLNEAELRNQLFVMYDYNRETLYLSNRRYQKTIMEIFKEQFEFEAKAVFANIHEFIKHVTSIKEVQFTSTADLFSQNQVQRNALMDLTGVESPSRFKIITDYKGQYPIKQLEKFLTSLDSEAQKRALSGLVIKGDNESGFEQIYNVDTLISKVAIILHKDENGIVDSNAAETLLRKEIEKDGTKE